MKILVVTLYSGENEYEQCCESVHSQVGLDITHVVIENLPNQEAHQKLYKLFNDSRSKYDYLAKLDADMVFSNQNSLKNILDKFSDNIDIVSASVHDGITNSHMQGFNVFSSNCYFHYNTNDALYADQLKIDYTGTHLLYTDHDRNILHAYNPSPFQAFMFGVHRAMKVMQYENNYPLINSSFHQKRILYWAYKNSLNNNSAHATHALVGATLVLSGDINNATLYRKSNYLDIFNSINDINEFLLDKRLKSDSLISLVRVLGLIRFSLGGFKLLISRVKKRISH